MGGILSEGMKFNGCKKTCDPCCNEKDIKYCGNRIDCLNIDRGDSSNEVFNKLGDAVCKNIQDIEILKDRTDIEVSENADCENGGIIIKDKNIIDPITDDYKVIYETCFPCCGSDDDCACLPEPPTDGGTYGISNGEWVNVNNNNLYVSIDPVNLQPEFNEMYGVTQGFDVNVSGGVAPYTYKWTMQQSGGNFLRLTDDSQQYPVIGALPDGSYTLKSSSINTHNNTISLNYFSGNIGMLPSSDVEDKYAGVVSVIHLKLVVTDSKGNKAKDYWTVYGYNTY
jgi:hypothetical protein